MAQRKKKSFEVLVALPWWLNILAAIAVYCILRLVLPAFPISNPLIKALTTGLAAAAPWFASYFLLTAILSSILQWRRAKLLDSQSSLDSIRAMSWQDFERLVAEVFHRQGYSVKENGGGGADGGIDLILAKPGQKVIVQCKRYRETSIGVTALRELYGVMADCRASGCVFVSSGTYTKDAEAFARGKAMQLINGKTLFKLISDIQQSLPVPVADAGEFAVGTPACPKCQRIMVKRLARTGSNKGKSFWGCSNFPSCKGTI